MDKFCKDCKHASMGAHSHRPWKWICHYPLKEVEFLNLASGEMETRESLQEFLYCEDLRESGFLFSFVHHLCGKSGRYWERRE